MATLADNKKIRFDYDVLETLEAGLVLSGQETKSVRNGGISLKGAFVTFRGDAAMLTNATIAPYKNAGPLPDYDTTHSRKLLLHKKQVEYLRGKMQEEGLTIVPLQVYTKARFIKVAVALCRGRKTFDKRAALKKRDTEREMRRVVDR